MFLLVLSALFLASCSKKSEFVDLSGTWQVSFDSLDTFQPIALPGTTDLAGLGEPNTLEPAIDGEQIQRLTRRNSFTGAAFYVREFEIPKNMAGRPLALTLERVLWQSSASIDGVPVGDSQESLVTPHRYVIAEGLEAGQHTICLRIDNSKRYDLSWRELAHSYTDDTQIIWNGVLGELSLKLLPSLELAHTDIYPDAAGRTARVVSTLVRHDPELAAAMIGYELDGRSCGSVTAGLSADTTVVEYIVNFPADAPLWDEFSPVLHTLGLNCYSGKKATDSKTYEFGLRDIASDGDRILINGRRVYMRGTLDCCIFPLTGTPPMDEDEWRHEFEVCREWGYNHIRFHSWCPPDAAFRVADEMGLYLQVELPVWSKTVGTPGLNAFMLEEYRRIIHFYGNHPSFCLLSGGNEADSGYEFLNELLVYMKNSDPRHLYTATTYSMGEGHKGRPEPEDQFMVASRTEKGQIRGQNSIASRRPDFRSDYSATASGIDIPLISHEIGQYSVYPDISATDKYTGVLDPLNLKGIRAELEKKGLLDKARDYTLASGRLAAILYKEEVERALKTPELAGFQVLGLQDFSGQATAHIGLVDAFWDDKGLVEASWFRQANAPVTPLVRYSSPCWTSDETFVAEIEVANYWKSDISTMVDWTLSHDGGVIASGSVPAELPTGYTTRLDGRIEVPLESLSDASELELRLTLREGGWTNSWNIWVYPAGQTLDTGEVTIARTADEALNVLSEGGSVLLAPDPRMLAGERGKFVPVFWSPVFFPDEAGTMGILCDPDDPALALFPTDMHSDWQWWNLTMNSTAVVLDDMPELHAIVEAVDNFVMNRRLAYIFEARCESGRLLFCSMDLFGPAASSCPEAGQLLYSLLDYMNSPTFNPEGRLDVGKLKSFFD